MKRIICTLLVLAMTVGCLPAVVRAEEEVKEDFLESVQQITWDDVVPEGYTPITTEEELRAMEQLPNGSYILMEDIVLSGPTMLFSKDTPFTGVFEGNGHTISGQTGTVGSGCSGIQYFGLFRYTRDARIADLKVSGELDVVCDTVAEENLIWSWYISGISGYSIGNSIFDNCVSDVRITIQEDKDYLNYYVGGIVGALRVESGQKAEINGCKNMASIVGYGRIGGVCGYVDIYGRSVLTEVTVTNCRNTGNITNRRMLDAVTTKTSTAAGIIGYAYGKMNCGMSVYACMNSGNVEGYNAAGVASSMYVGGYSTAYEWYATVSSCANTGAISGAADAAGVLGSSSTTISDCINTGTVTGTTEVARPGGVVCAQAATRCINVGVVEGTALRGAIAYSGNDESKEECDAKFVDCFWLNLGDEYTRYAVMSYYGENPGDYTGRLSTEQMAQEESFTNFDFENTWTMVAEYGYPFPTVLLDLKLDNKYYENYIQDTFAFANASLRYTSIMGGSGDAGLAGALGEMYDRTQADAVGDLWDRMQFVEDLADCGIPDATMYDVMLADLIYGTVGKDTLDEHITAQYFSTLSEVMTTVGLETEALDVLAAEGYLAELADIPSIFSSSVQGKVNRLIETVTKDLDMPGFEAAMEGFGGCVDIADAIGEGVDTKEEAIDFFVLCNAHANTVKTYAGLILEAAEKAKEYDAAEGAALYSDAVAFHDDILSNANGNLKALYQETNASAANILTTSGFTILENVLSFESANPVLAYFKAIKTGYCAGMSVADLLTNMDDISYYGTMMEMAELFARGLYLEVLERKDAFAHSKSYEDALALNTATTLYLNLQILACDYGIGYGTAIASAKLADVFGGNADELFAITRLQAYKAELQKLQRGGYGVGVGYDGSIYGFIANCPVTVVVTDADGNEISRMETGSIATADGYGGNYLLLGEESQHKAGFFEPEKHTVTIIGEKEGTMDLVIYGADNGKLTFVDGYGAVPVSQGLTYTVGEGMLDGETDVLPTTRQEFRTKLDGVIRIAGDDRIATSLMLADQLKDVLGVEKFDAVIVASALNFPDALTGSYLAAEKKAPILLTYPAAHAKIRAYIQENLQPGGMVYILGGEGAVSADFANGLNGFNIKRLAGSDRFGTNLEIMKEAGVSADQPVLIATAMNFADSLSASAAGLPMVLVYGSLRDDQKAFLETTSKNFVIIGGDAAVPVAIENELKDIGTVTRLAGSSRYETSVLVSQRFVPDPDAVVLAYALNFPDGLCGGPVAYALGAPLILTDNASSGAADKYIDGITAGIVVGGAGLISDETVNLIFDTK